MNQATFNYIIGKKGNSKSEYLKDSDRDKVINILDCKPYDKNRQGVMHTIGAYVANKVGAKETAAKIEARGEYVDQQKAMKKEMEYEAEAEVAQGASSEDIKKKYTYESPVREKALKLVRDREIRDATEEASFKVKKELAIKQATERAKQPSGFAGIGGFFNSFSSKRPTQKAQTGRRKVTTYVKKGNHYIKKTHYVTSKAEPRVPSRLADRNRNGIPDIFGSKTDKNRDGIPDIMGLKNKKYGGIPKIF